MESWLIGSLAFHIIILLALWLGLPQFQKPLPEPPKIIPIEIAELGPITAAKRVDQNPQPEPPKPEEKPEPPKPPEPVPPAPTPPPEQAKPPEPVPPTPKPPEPPKPEEKPEPVPSQKPKPPEPPKPEPPKRDALASVLKNVAKLKTEQKPPEKPVEKPPQKNPTPPVISPQPDPTATAKPSPSAPLSADRLMISEEDALRRQITSCWNVPVGARDIQNISVEVYIAVNPDRTLREAMVVDQARMARDTFFRAVAESALRALRNPRCSPLALPPEKYDQWREMIFNFNPRDMF